jgi:ElaB/YqjD/DUF883 family membrane-anchored ribosome-binding protein
MARASRLAGPTRNTAAIEALIEELETRLLRINSAARQEASGVTDDLNAFIDHALADIAGKLRNRTQSLTASVADQTSRMGSDMLKKLGGEMHRHPMAALALAAGLGFLVGVAGNRAG